MDNKLDRSAMFDFLADMLIDSNMPEEHKICIKICREGKKNCDKLMRISDIYADPTGREDDQSLFQLRKEVHEYLQLVGVGLEQFISTHPILGGGT